MKNKIFAKTILCVFLCVAFGAQSFVLVQAKQEVGPEIESRMDELLELYGEISLYDLTREEAIIVMLRTFLERNPDAVPYLGEALLTAFDPYGRYYEETGTDEMFSSAYIGFGIELGGKESIEGKKYGTTIEWVFDESPAFDAGLLRGDEIIKIGETDVEGFGMNAVSNLLSSCPDKIEIVVRRNGAELAFSLSRSTVFMQSVTFYLDEKSKTATIKISDFLDEYMVYDIYGLMEYLDENAYKNVIIDLRGNPGGDVLNMLEILNMFVPEKGVVIYSQIDKNGKLETVESSGHGIAFDKICVLADGASASAAEIFTLALRELTGATVIGETTYGKGVGQYYEQLSNGDTVAITAFEALSPSGAKYNGKGIAPDIKISPEYKTVEPVAFEQLNFVNCRQIKSGAENSAVLALNQRLAAIGYIRPEDVTSLCTEQTKTAVEIFQKYNGLAVGISKIDYVFIEHLGYYVDIYSMDSYMSSDLALECAKIFAQDGEQAARDFAEGK
ncbi:MAG: S41 family peptidase [Oscillospiraceae bacterium]|nr:S41 family peptidase [Oscillospiraceae bacterium]